MSELVNRVMDKKDNLNQSTWWTLSPLGSRKISESFCVFQSIYPRRSLKTWTVPVRHWYLNDPCVTSALPHVGPKTFSKGKDNYHLNQTKLWGLFSRDVDVEMSSTGVKGKTKRGILLSFVVDMVTWVVGPLVLERKGNSFNGSRTSREPVTIVRCREDGRGLKRSGLSYVLWQTPVTIDTRLHVPSYTFGFPLPPLPLWDRSAMLHVWNEDTIMKSLKLLQHTTRHTKSIDSYLCTDIYDYCDRNKQVMSCFGLVDSWQTRRCFTLRSWCT